jgi:soluble lytic murein transglycosylase-like protein
MKLFAAALSVPALAIAGAIGLAIYGTYEGITKFVFPPPKPPHIIALRIKPPAFPLSQIIQVTARKHGVKIGFIRSIIAAESTFHRNAVSAKGAIGLMQVMPETAHEMGDDPKVPEQNIDAGARYLKSLLYRYRNCRDQVKRAIAAYNAGPGNVDKYNGIPPFPETQSYVRRVMAFYERF